MKPLVITLSGQSGSGKTVLSHLLEKEGSQVLISTTTRLPRKGEVEGVDYFFVSKGAFIHKKNQGAFIENIEYDSNMYGVEAKQVLEKNGKGPSVIVVEPEGANEIEKYCRENDWDIIKVFVGNPIELLLNRVLIRFQNDCFELNPSKEKDMKILKEKALSYSGRIKRISQFEDVHWVQPAKSGAHRYDLIVEGFDADTQQEVLDKIEAIVHQKHKQELRSKSVM